MTDVSLEKNVKTNHLWVVPLAGGGAERQLTTASGESNGRGHDTQRVVQFLHVFLQNPLCSCSIEWTHGKSQALSGRFHFMFKFHPKPRSFLMDFP